MGMYICICIVSPCAATLRWYARQNNLPMLENRAGMHHMGDPQMIELGDGTVGLGGGGGPMSMIGMMMMSQMQMNANMMSMMNNMQGGGNSQGGGNRQRNRGRKRGLLELMRCLRCSPPDQGGPQPPRP